MTRRLRLGPRATENIDFAASLELGELQELLADHQIRTELRRGGALERETPWVSHGYRSSRRRPRGPHPIEVASGGTRELWDVPEPSRQHEPLREDARKWADALGRLRELDSW